MGLQQPCIKDLYLYSRNHYLDQTRFDLVVANYQVAPRKVRTPRARVRNTRIRAKKNPISLDRIEDEFTKFLRKRVGRTWESVYKSILDFSKKLEQPARVYVESLYDSYIELHPRRLKDGSYERRDGISIESKGLFFVDLGGILREGGPE